MKKIHSHVMILLGTLVFCVGLINMVGDDSMNDLFTFTMEESEGNISIPTLSASINYNIDDSFIDSNKSNYYIELLEQELNSFAHQESISQNTSTTVEERVTPEKPTTSVKKTPAKKGYVEKWALVTAYCPCSKCCGTGTPGRTSIGKSAWKSGIAADPRALSYGTEIYVKGYGKFKVDDTGGAMRRSWRRKGLLHLDIRMKYHYNARKWGRKMMKVRVYNKK